MKHHRDQKKSLEKQKRIILQSKYLRKTGQKSTNQKPASSHSSPFVKEQQKFAEKQAEQLKKQAERVEKQKAFKEKKKERAIRGQKIARASNPTTKQPNLNMKVMGILESLKKEVKLKK